MISCSFWAAGHITAFFKIADAVDDILHKGSRGVGFNIKRGVITEVTNSHDQTHQIFFDGVKQPSIKAGITIYVMNELQSLFTEKFPFLNIYHTFEIPIGSGYGSSAAAALSTAFAINSFLNLNLSDLVLWQIAHKAEIINKTGLGDVLGMYSQSPFEMRIKEGAPGVGQVVSLDFDVSGYDLYTFSIGPLSKRFLLTDPDKRASITTAGDKALENFQSNPTFENFCYNSITFAQHINLLPKNIWKIVHSMPPTIKVSQIMLGESLFFFVPKDEDIRNYEDVETIKEELVHTTIKKIK